MIVERELQKDRERRARILETLGRESDNDFLQELARDRAPLMGREIITAAWATHTNLESAGVNLEGVEQTVGWPTPEDRVMERMRWPYSGDIEFLNSWGGDTTDPGDHAALGAFGQSLVCEPPDLEVISDLLAGNPAEIDEDKLGDWRYGLKPWVIRSELLAPKLAWSVREVLKGRSEDNMLTHLRINRPALEAAHLRYRLMGRLVRRTDNQLHARLLGDPNYESVPLISDVHQALAYRHRNPKPLEK